jgi:hypothetical protein
VFMKKNLLVRLLFATGVMCWLPASVSVGADTNSAAATGAVTPQAAAPAPAPPRLPYGVDDVLKLSRAQIGDDVILNYIHGMGTVYNLKPVDIVYLKNAGVSDRVINAMLEQGRQTEVAAQPAVPSVPNTAAVPSATSAQVAPTYAAPTYAAPTYTAPAPTYTYVQPSAPASSVYVIPYPTPSYPAYYNYPYAGYYSPYYYGGYWGPRISFGFAFGSGHGGHGGGHGGHH